MRPGSYYRTLVADRLGIRAGGGWTLDLGACDGRLLQHMNGRGIALDLRPEPAAGIAFVRGDATNAPFPSETFPLVLAMDVLEHVDDDARLMREVLRLLAPGGSAWVSVPSRKLSVFPPFLTPLAHRSWGHVRPGYTREGLQRLLPSDLGVTLHDWNEPAYRAAYLPIRIVARVAPPVARWVIRIVAAYDARHREGECGHFFIRIAMPGSSATG